MNRIPRTAAALVLTAALLAAATPAAQARTLASPQSPSLSGSWFDAALVWLGAFGDGAPQAALAHRAPAMKSTGIPPGPPPDGPGLGPHPNAGSTLDPNGGHCVVCGAGG
jgi:hypothetical protein